jgi:transcriptional regulator with XRE-family HTH domain
MKLKNLFASNLKRLRQEKGYTQQELAELCNMSTTTIGMYEVGGRTPSFATIELIAEKLGIDASQLFSSEKYYNLEKSEEKLKLELGRAVADFDRPMLKYMIKNAQVVKETFTKKRKKN